MQYLRFLLIPQLSTSSSNPPLASSSEPPSTSASKPCPSSSTGLPICSANHRPMFKPVLSWASSDVLDQKGKKSFVRVEKDSLPIFAIPNDMKDLIKNGIMPKVLNQPLTPTTYKDYFTTFLYVEEFYYKVFFVMPFSS
ncbi:RNA helicase SDE3 [Pyrus ussuriensis x Pyrus communis]|uniref:RNA helicase SDE3 n=1 Tax=Pyrus ussuriensis x Pyrus communis TaxID=2448454 RepID=A0A5N5GXV6_9ROSA|nr:RNA helicase SDE3 [Pyrus ussuriensis x Pyrus communis]